MLGRKSNPSTFLPFSRFTEPGFSFSVEPPLLLPRTGACATATRLKYYSIIRSGAQNVATPFSPPWRRLTVLSDVSVPLTCHVMLGRVFILFYLVLGLQRGFWEGRYRITQPW